MSTIGDLAGHLADPGDPTAMLRVGVITEIAATADRKVRTDQTDTAWLARDQDTRLAVGDRVWMVKQGSTFLVAGRLNSGLTEPVVKRKTSGNQSVTSSATPVNDTDIFYALPIGTYRVELFAHFESTSVTPDLRSMWSFSGTVASGGRTCLGPGVATTAVDGSATTSVMRSTGHGFATEITYGTDAAGASPGTLREDLLLIVTVAGTLRWMWAQGTSNAAATIVSAATRLYISPVRIL